MPHIHEKFDFTVTCYIVHENRVLLILHKKLKRWLPIGGHIELDEEPIRALFREIQEECGVDVELLETTPHPGDRDVTVLPTPEFLDHHAITDTHRHINLTYFARAKNADAVLNREEHDGIRWFFEADLEDPSYGLGPVTTFYAKSALRKARA